jgi:exonuclease III
MYEDEELRPYLVDPQKQTQIDLQSHVEKLKTDGHEVMILTDTNQAEEQVYQTPTHNEKFVTQKGFHVDRSIDSSLQSFIQNCGLINVLRRMHEGVVPNNHARGSAQIDFTLITSVLDDHVVDVGLLDRSILQSDHSGMFVDLRIEGIFG